MKRGTKGVRAEVGSGASGYWSIRRDLREFDAVWYVIASRYLLPLPPVCPLRTADCHAYVQCLQLYDAIDSGLFDLLFTVVRIELTALVTSDDWIPG
jgi:hypothetical protein